ncbi:MAG: branched-chain amino acid ABC transporter substrate-binding protein [Acidimicrobiia bacterium]|nr:branched-chain amino acid ABC transporter substrate-binding protein [Acidimicrobiia bacterium]
MPWRRITALLLTIGLGAAACGSDSTEGTDTTGGSSATTEGAGSDTSEGGSANGDCSDPVGCVTVAEGDPIQVGTLLVISGSDASLGQDSQNGAVLGVDYLDGELDGTPGQIAGHDVKWQHEDDGCSADGGQAGGEALAANSDIVAVIGTSCSSAALGVADKIMSDAGIPLISPSNTGPALTGEDHQPFYLRTAHNDKIQGAVVAGFVQGEKGLKTAATINDESPYADGLAAAFRTAFEKDGGTITSVEAIKSDDTDFTNLLNSIAQAKPEVLYFPVFTSACSLIAKQAAEIMPDTLLISSDGCLSAGTIETAGDAVNGLFASSPDLSVFASGDFYSKEFLPAYQEQFGSAPTAVFHAHAFDAVQILAQAIEKVAVKNSDGGLTIPRDGLREALFATKDYKGITGTITCLPSGDCATNVTIGVFEGPAWPVEGGSKDAKAVYSDTKSLADIGG